MIYDFKRRDFFFLNTKIYFSENLLFLRLFLFVSYSSFRF